MDSTLITDFIGVLLQNYKWLLYILIILNVLALMFVFNKILKEDEIVEQKEN